MYSFHRKEAPKAKTPTNTTRLVVTYMFGDADAYETRILADTDFFFDPDNAEHTLALNEIMEQYDWLAARLPDIEETNYYEVCSKLYWDDLPRCPLSDYQFFGKVEKMEIFTWDETGKLFTITRSYA